MKHLLAPEEQNVLRRQCMEYGTASYDDVLKAGQTYLDSLISYNRTVPLMSRAGDQMARAVQLFMSSLAVMEFLPKESGAAAIDLGSGGGFPAVPLKILRPDLSWILVESRQRKCAFLEAVAHRINFSGFEVVNGRFEEYSPPEDHQIRIITSRAGPPVASVLKWAKKIPGLELVVLFEPSSDEETVNKAADEHDFYLFKSKLVKSRQVIAPVTLFVLKKKDS